jgi:hypothetical protein
LSNRLIKRYAQRTGGEGNARGCGHSWRIHQVPRYTMGIVENPIILSTVLAIDCLKCVFVEALEGVLWISIVRLYCVAIGLYTIPVFLSRCDPGADFSVGN